MSLRAMKCMWPVVAVFFLDLWGEGERRPGWCKLGDAAGFRVTGAVQEEDPADAQLRLAEGAQESAAHRR